MYSSFADARADLYTRWLLSKVAKPSLGDGPTVVMTTHATRMLTAHHSIRCILGGTVRPGRFIVYVPSAPTPNLLAFKDVGAEIVQCDPKGVHDKWYHYSQQNSEPFVTVDDDFVYPPDLLATICAAVACAPTFITAMRARYVQQSHYAQWPLADNTQPSHLHMALGCGGVYYPEQMVTAMKWSRTDFLKLCPKADDLWLKRLAIEAGIRVRLGVLNRPLPLLSPGTPGTGLWHENVTNGKNDEQWGALLTDTMREVLLREVDNHYEATRHKKG
jgi:hypothetical protein